MEKRKITKLAINLVVGASAGYVIGSILKNNVTADTIPQKIKAQVGGYVLGAMVSERASSWTDAKVDAVFAWWDNKTQKTPEAV